MTLDELYNFIKNVLEYKVEILGQLNNKKSHHSQYCEDFLFYSDKVCNKVFFETLKSPVLGIYVKHRLLNP